LEEFEESFLGYMANNEADFIHVGGHHDARTGVILTAAGLAADDAA
jgi:hypothetical protein